MKKDVKTYYEHFESKYGYKIFLKDAQHFGYYPNIDDNITEYEAQNKLHDLLIEKLELNPGNYLLDAGCGRGIVSSYIAKHNDVKILGVDIVPYIVEKAKKRSKLLNLDNKLTYINSSYSSLDIKNNTFDRIYSVETLSHATNLDKTLKEFNRVLKPNGIGVFIEYEIASFDQFNEYELKMYKLVRDGSAMNSLNNFVEGNFKKLLIKNGFEILEDLDITKNRSKSMKRLYNFAIIPYQLIKLLGLRKTFINTTAGVEFYILNEKNLFRYHLYKTRKIK